MLFAFALPFARTGMSVIPCTIDELVKIVYRRTGFGAREKVSFKAVGGCITEPLTPHTAPSACRIDSVGSEPKFEAHVLCAIAQSPPLSSSSCSPARWLSSSKEVEREKERGHGRVLGLSSIPKCQPPICV